MAVTESIKTSKLWSHNLFIICLKKMVVGIAITVKIMKITGIILTIKRNVSNTTDNVNLLKDHVILIITMGNAKKTENGNGRKTGNRKWEITVWKKKTGNGKTKRNYDRIKENKRKWGNTRK